MSTDGADLVLVDVGKRYGRGRWVLRHVELTLQPGVLLHVSGANGSGKSSLLRVIAGVSTLTAGHAARPRVCRIVPDRAAITPRLRAGEYVMAMGRMQGLAGPRVERRAHDLLDQLHFVGDWNEQIARLSRGNARKLAISQPFMTSAQMIVLDEPWSDLDASAAHGLSQLVDTAAGDGAMIAFTDHSGNAFHISSSVPGRSVLVRDGAVTHGSPISTTYETVVVRAVRVMGGRFHQPGTRSGQQHDAVTALVRYWALVLVRSQRYFPPLTLFVIGVVVLTTNGTGPLTAAYGAVAAVLFPAAVWLSIATFGAETGEQLAVINLSAGSLRRVVIAAVIVQLLACMALAAFGIAFPVVTGHSDVSMSAVLIGIGVQGVAAVVGTAVGVISSRLVLHRTPATLVVALLLIVVSYTVRWASPLREALVVADQTGPARSAVLTLSPMALREWPEQ